MCFADTEFGTPDCSALSVHVLKMYPGIYPGNNKLQYVSELDTRPPSEQPRMTVYRSEYGQTNKRTTAYDSIENTGNISVC